MQIEQMIVAVQQVLGIHVDGKAGPQTWSAIYARLVREVIDGQLPADAISAVDSHSEKIIVTLQPEVQPMARSLVQRAQSVGITIRIIDGLRTYQEQDALYAKGRTAGGKIVTNAPGGHSCHNFGIAFDVGVFEGDEYLGNSQKYKAVGVLGMDMGLEWGGNWKNFVDQPHFQLRPPWAMGLTEGKMLIEIRRRQAAGEKIYD